MNNEWFYQRALYLFGIVVFGVMLFGIYSGGYDAGLEEGYIDGFTDFEKTKKEQFNNELEVYYSFDNIDNKSLRCKDFAIQDKEVGQNGN